MGLAREWPDPLDFLKAIITVLIYIVVTLLAHIQWLRS